MKALVKGYPHQYNALGKGMKRKTSLESKFEEENFFGIEV